MHGSLGEARALVAALRSGAGTSAAAEMLLCPPYVYLSAVKDGLAGSALRLGAQDLSDEVGKGAFTGEIAGGMLADVGCSHVIVGHSERRALYRESDELVATKFRAAQSAGLIPILCVGETLAEREANSTRETVARQIDAVLNAAGAAAFGAAVIAYEPVWAIGTGRVATPEDAEEVCAAIRGWISDRHGSDITERIRILYGGSVNASNVAALMAQPDIDGCLVGAASLKADEFAAIARFYEMPMF